MKNAMYPENVYIQNYDELKELRDGNGRKPDMFVQLNIFDEKHGLQYNELARAQYRHWRSVETGAPDMMSQRDRELLGL